MNHAQLVEIGRRFLMRKHALVITEIGTIDEEPDALGWSDGLSTLIEAKATVNDFYSDSRKSFRRNAESGVGNFRYYLTPKGLVKNPEKLRDGWGLLETTGVRINCIKKSKFFDKINCKQERRILTSAFRRLGQTAPEGVSCKAYYIHTGNRATVTIEVDNPTTDGGEG